MAKPDMVNAPPHYIRGGIEAVDVIEAWELGFRLGNAVAYILRADYKGHALEDLKKARWMLDREIGAREGGIRQVAKVPDTRWRPPAKLPRSRERKR